MHFPASKGNDSVANDRNFGASLSKSLIGATNFFNMFDDPPAMLTVSFFVS